MAAELATGSRLGEWILEESLGKGGYAEVWRARHNTLSDRRVAIKIPHDLDFAAALKQEGVVQDGLEGPHILPVLGLDPDNDPPYLVVQLVEGTSLRDRINAGPVPPDEVTRLLLEICSGLETAHAQGVVHRDLKPENVLLDRAGKAYVSDFGLGLISETMTGELLMSGALRTQSGRDVVGTLRYMAPEQRDPETAVDTRADLYALGVVLFELLTGEAPCGGEVPSEVIPGLDPRFDEVFRGLYARLASRTPSVAQVIVALESISAAPVDDAPDPALAGAARCADVPAGLTWRAMAFCVDVLPFFLLALGPLKVGRGLGAVALFVAYDVVATSLTSRTVGKWLFGMRVATEDGKRPDMTRAFLREALRVVSIAFGGLGYLTALGPTRRALHDVFAGTQVLHDSRRK